MRRHANMVSRYTHTGFDYQSFSHFLLCHKYNSFRMHSKQDPIPRSLWYTASAASTSQCPQIYIIGLVPSTIVHGIMPHLFEKQETTKQCNLGTRALAHCASLTERPSVGSWRGSPTNNKPVLKSGKRQKPNSLS